MKQRQLVSIFLFCVVLNFIPTETAISQYWDEGVLEKSFEHMDFYFTPSHLNPFGIGSFANSTPGLMDDPLLNLIVNPAFLFSDSMHSRYLYMDFRGINAVETQDYGVMPMYHLDVSSSCYFPTYYMESRKEVLPVFSAAFLSRPFSRRLPGLFLGFTYQAILQDDDYYDIPTDIYKSNVGYDYSGEETAFRDVPIVDRYSGEDKMNLFGNFIAVHAGYDIAGRAQIGLKLSRVTFEQDGAYGSTNFWSDVSSPDYTSLWRMMESRNQNYDHWDISSGLNIKLTSDLSVGFSGGYLVGDVLQTLTNQDSSYYKYGEINMSESWSYSNTSGNSDKSWKHDGSTKYAGFNLKMKLSPTNLFQFYYKFQHQRYDILLNSSDIDTSFSSYYDEWEGNSYFSEYDYSLSDFRTGGGDNSLTNHTLFAGFQWKIETNKKLNFGVVFQKQDQRTETQEDVFSDRHSRGAYSSIYDGRIDDSDYYTRTREQKELFWDFHFIKTSLQIPLTFHWQVSPSAELIFGFNRKMARWKIEDVTLAIFDYREVSTDSTLETETNFGERYTQPVEARTDIETNLIAGITVRPSSLFVIRFLVMPNFREDYNGSTLRDYQWWIGLNLYP